MRSNIVLIDFENVRPDSLSPLPEASFRVIVFVGATQTKIPFEFANAMQKMGSRAEYIKMSGSGQNALDFHIAFYIGQLAAKDVEASFHIISNDAGFDPLIEHLRSKNISATRAASIYSLPFFQMETKKPQEDKTEIFIARLQDSKYPRPRTEQTLTRSLGAFLGNQRSNEELANLVESMQKQGIISISNGKVSYAVDGKSSPSLSKA